MAADVMRPLPRVGLLWRGGEDPSAASTRATERLCSLLAAFGAIPVEVDQVAYSDDSVTDVRECLLGCDVVMVWVNPIQDGANRAGVDALLREIAAGGVIVSAHPETILTLGTKRVLYRLRDLPFGSDVELYRTADEFAARFPARLASFSRLVVKHGRGNGGNGVWKVELSDGVALDGPIEGDIPVRVIDAQATDGSSQLMPLTTFIALASADFEWSGCLIDQPFQERLAEGMLRCYFCQDQVVGFARQWPKRGLLDPQEAYAAASGPATVMADAHAPAYQTLRLQAEDQWLPAVMQRLGLEQGAMPLIWDADFLFGPPTSNGEDTYVLCEINASAVWPFPPDAAPTVAQAAHSAANVRRAK